MRSSRTESTSDLIKKEFENMHKELKPLLMKCLLYSVISAPLFSFSFMSLYYLVFEFGVDVITLPVILFSLTGAFSFALLREAFHKNKEMKEASRDYIKKRIRESEYMDIHYKEDYLKKIQDKPRDMFKIFVEFLERENRTRMIKNRESDDK
ncbi:hypothetical protein J2S74_004179 [Evansella vedderi]|uniref:Uncharacterized protein n=1 Tax=Evansella vedderi TaxID=38282 RepID=A0ABT9ZZU1_9BACI|nr:DUF5392 family protein [Evansella vedderi]MDQ0256757.1 hypothetical protein [Evansella vedderi]